MQRLIRSRPDIDCFFENSQTSLLPITALLGCVALGETHHKVTGPLPREVARQASWKDNPLWVVWVRRLVIAVYIVAIGVETIVFAGWTVRAVAMSTCELAEFALRAVSTLIACKTMRHSVVTHDELVAVTAFCRTEVLRSLFSF